MDPGRPQPGPGLDADISPASRPRAAGPAPALGVRVRKALRPSAGSWRGVRVDGARSGRDRCCPRPVTSLAGPSRAGACRHGRRAGGFRDRAAAASRSLASSRKSHLHTDWRRGRSALSPSSLPDLGPSWGGSQQHHRPLLRTRPRERRKPAAPHAAHRPSLWGALCRATARRLDLCSAPWGQLPSPPCPAALSSWSENEALGRVSPDTPREHVPAGGTAARVGAGSVPACSQNARRHKRVKWSPVRGPGGDACQRGGVTFPKRPVARAGSSSRPPKAART